jgi:hypothetical protein
MEKLELFFGKRTWGTSTIYLTPTILITVSTDKHETRHSFSAEFQWILSGVGIKLFWKNKKVVPYPDLSDLLL